MEGHYASSNTVSCRRRRSRIHLSPVLGRAVAMIPQIAP